MPKKKNDGLDLKTFSILMSILVVFGGVVWFFATQNSKIEYMEKQMNQFKEDLVSVRDQYNYTNRERYSVDENLLNRVEKLEEKADE